VLELESANRFHTEQRCWVAKADERDGKLVFLDGQELGQTLEARKLIESIYGTERADQDWFLISQSGYKGLSGSPVITESGRVVGVLIGGIESPGGGKISVVMGAKALTAIVDAVN
jgi:hypothetical protein